MSSLKPYYINQDDWSNEDFYRLHRYLHRLILYYDKKKDEIVQLDISKMSEKTRVLLYCIINYYHLDNLLKMKNLKGLRDCKPLSEPLMLSKHGMKDDGVYYRMNVIF